MFYFPLYHLTKWGLWILATLASFTKSSVIANPALFAGCGTKSWMHFQESPLKGLKINSVKQHQESALYDSLCPGFRLTTIPGISFRIPGICTYLIAYLLQRSPSPVSGRRSRFLHPERCDLCTPRAALRRSERLPGLACFVPGLREGSEWRPGDECNPISPTPPA